MRRGRTDPLARRAVLAIAAGRVGVGVGALVATRPALRALGLAETDETAQALARLAGSRDIAVGLLTLAAREEAAWLRAATIAAISIDAADALTLGLASRRPGLRRGGIGGALSGAAAAVVGSWAWRRLGPR